VAEGFHVSGCVLRQGLRALTRAAGMVIMGAGAIFLVRRITTCLVLVALIGIYAMPLAAALSPSAMDCCAAGMCPMPGRSLARHQSVIHTQPHSEMPDCGMGSLSGSLRKCEMGACATQKDNVVNVGLFVLSAPMGIVRSLVQVPVLAAAPQSEHSVSQIPATPPPRISLS
jgi:hypothetical protein